MASKKRGLGRGLNALLGEVEILKTETSLSDLQNLPVEYLQRGQYQPRHDIDPEKLQELSDSIKAQGIIQPIIVRELEEDKYEIIAGERRWRAAQLAQLDKVPVVIKQLDEKAAMAIALIENIQREDLNPLEEAEALKKLLDAFTMTHQQLADAVGKSRTNITNLLRLLDLSSEVKKLIFKNLLGMGHARALLTLNEHQQIKLANKIVNLGLNVREAELLVKQLQQKKEPSEKNKKNIDKDTLHLQQQLTEKLNAKVAIKHKENGSGSLVISYTSLDELDGILERFDYNYRK